MAYEDDILYLKLLVFSFFASLIAKRLPNRDLFAAFIGLVFVITACRCHLLYSLTCVIINLTFLLYLPNKRLGLFSFIFTFSYLMFFRCAHFVGLPKPYPHANAVQLLMTLRCIGLAFEVSDARSAISTNENPIIKPPSLLEAFCYYYNFAGLFTGPYYSYRVHADMVKKEAGKLALIDVRNEIIPRLLISPFYILLMLIVDYYFPLQAVHNNEFYAENGFLFRLCYMVPVFVFLRMRVYTAWSLSESVCIANGIGAYPVDCKPKPGQGPTDLEAFRIAEENCSSGQVINYNFETIRNIDPYGCEFSNGFRSGMRSWNKSVQYWLAVYIYRRSPRAYRMPLTMLVSAFWHGIHPGYYLSFLTIPLCTAAEDFILKEEQFNFWWWFVRQRGFEYMSMGFLLLTWTSTIRYWMSIYFCIHIVTGFVLLFYGYLMRKKKKD